MLERIADGLGVPRGFMGLAYTDEAAHGAATSAGLHRTKDDFMLERRGFLGLISKIVMGAVLTQPEVDLLAVGPDTTPVPNRVGATDVVQVRALTAALRSYDAAHGGGSCRDAILAHTHWAQSLLHASATDAVRTSLLSAIAEAKTMAGWTAHDLGLQSDAQRWLGQAVRDTQDAGDPAHTAIVLYHLGRVPLDNDDPAEALKLFQLGQIAAQDSHSSVADLAGYLPRTAGTTAGDTANRWDPVLRALAEHPDHPLAATLTTPLSVGLARVIYSDTTGPDPAELLDAERFPTAASISDHLLTRFVPTVCRPEPLDRAVGLDQRWSAEQAARWFRFLAAHLSRRHTTDLAWWEFGTALRRRSRTLVLGLFAGVTATVVDWLVEGVASAFGTRVGSSPWFLSGLLIGFFGAVLMVISYGLVIGRDVPAPVSLRISVRSGGRRLTAEKKSRLRLGVLCGSVFGVCLGTAHRLLDVVTSRSASSLVA